MEKNQKNNVIVVRVGEVVRLFVRRLWIVVLMGALFAALGYGYASTKKTAPVYMSTTKMYVKGIPEDVPSSAGMVLGKQIINNYIQILKSRPVLEQVIENLNLKMSYGELKNCIMENVPADTCMLEISVSFPEPEWAKKVADEIVKVSAVRAQEIIGSNPPVVYEEANIPMQSYNVEVYTLKYVLIGGIAGVGAACFIILLSYLLSTKLDSPSKVKDKLHLKLLGVIPASDAKNAEYEQLAYQNFCSRLFFETPSAKVIDFVSETEKENKYVLMQKTAESLKKIEKKVVLLDVNMSNPEWCAAETKAANQKGLEVYLTGKAEVNDIMEQKEGISYIYCGEAVMNAPELLGGEKFRELLEQLKQEYDYILVDTSPLEYVPDALCAAEQADAVVLVFSEKTSRTNKAKIMLDSLQERELPIAGAVIKDMNIRKGGKYLRKEFGKYFGVYTK